MGFSCKNTVHEICRLICLSVCLYIYLLPTYLLPTYLAKDQNKRKGGLKLQKFALVGVLTAQKWANPRNQGSSFPWSWLLNMYRYVTSLLPLAHQGSGTMLSLPTDPHLLSHSLQ